MSDFSPVLCGAELDVSYVVPIRAASCPSSEFFSYLSFVQKMVDQVVVVDGSDYAVFDALSARLPAGVVHLATPRHSYARNGKTVGINAALSLVRAAHVVIADDDVEFTQDSLQALVSRLRHADAVMPQNFFVGRLVWHAVYETSRMVFQRSFGYDFAGTVAIRRVSLRGVVFDERVLFDNLEVLRTILARGGRVVCCRDVYIAKRPPSTRQFFRQRVRQAYDEFARPLRLVVSLLLLPLGVAVPKMRYVLVIAGLVLGEVGRRRDGGEVYFPLAGSLCVPLWVLERSICSWLALFQRLTGGAYFGGQRLPTAANSIATLGRSSPAGEVLRSLPACSRSDLRRWSW
jgi:hypothetical protein